MSNRILTVKVSDQELHEMVRNGTAFPSYPDLLEHCRKGYIPTLSLGSGNHVIIGAALAADGIDIFWRG